MVGSPRAHGEDLFFDSLVLRGSEIPLFLRGSPSGEALLGCIQYTPQLAVKMCFIIMLFIEEDELKHRVEVF